MTSRYGILLLLPIVVTGCYFVAGGDRCEPGILIDIESGTYVSPPNPRQNPRTVLERATSSRVLTVDSAAGDVVITYSISEDGTTTTYVEHWDIVETRDIEL